MDLEFKCESLAVVVFAAAIGGIGPAALWHLRRQCASSGPWAARSPAGITASGFGAGAALTIVPISNMINSFGYQQAFLFFGTASGRHCLPASWLLLTPPPGVYVAGWLSSTLASHERRRASRATTTPGRQCSLKQSEEQECLLVAETIDHVGNGDDGQCRAGAKTRRSNAGARRAPRNHLSALPTQVP